MKNYTRKHIETGQFANSTDPKGYTFINTKGWKDYLIHPNLIFSHRQNNYTAATFEEGLHTHDYYEAVLYISGDVEYICENEVSVPKPGMFFFCPPDKMHTTRLLSEGTYERFVFYFDREFFTYCGEEISAHFLTKPKPRTLQPDEALFAKLRYRSSRQREAGPETTCRVGAGMQLYNPVFRYYVNR